MAAVGAAVGAAATGLGVLTKQAVSAYSAYEQLTGGVDTLFKTASDQVMQYANNAYKTAGLSANAYMDTVTSFSASLIASLDGDTAAAAEKANGAITDMHYIEQSEAIKKQSIAYQLIRTATFTRGSTTTRQLLRQRARNRMVMPELMANLLMDCI